MYRVSTRVQVLRACMQVVHSCKDREEECTGMRTPQRVLFPFPDVVPAVALCCKHAQADAQLQGQALGMHVLVGHAHRPIPRARPCRCTVLRSAVHSCVTGVQSMLGLHRVLVHARVGLM